MSAVVVVAAISSVSTRPTYTILLHTITLSILLFGVELSEFMKVAIIQTSFLSGV
jgi:hypothetical protein